MRLWSLLGCSLTRASTWSSAPTRASLAQLPGRDHLYGLLYPGH